MGWKDERIDVIIGVFQIQTLYVCRNGIVIDVLVELFKELLKDEIR